MNTNKDSDLLKMRQMGNNNPNNLRQIAVRIYDKKLKSFLALDTKEQVLESCQQLLINKTVDYMNVITELETGQLKSLNSINDLLYQKSNTIGNLNSTLIELKETNKEQSITITFLNKDIEVLKKQINDTQIKLQVTEERLIKTIQQSQRKINLLKSQYYQTKSNLERENKELLRQLENKIDQLKNATANGKIEIANIKSSQEKQIMEINRKYKQIISKYQMDKEEISKDKKYLQDLIEVKDDQIKEVKKEKLSISPKKWALGNGGKINILVPPVEQLEIPSRNRPRSRSRVVQKDKKDQPKKGGDKRKQKQKEKEKVNQKDKQREKDKTKEREKEKDNQNVQKRDFGVQISELIINALPLIPVVETVQCQVQVVIEDPIEYTQDQAQRKIRYYLDEQYRLLFNQKVRQLNKKYAQEYKKALNDTKSIVFQISALTKQQIKLSNTKFLQMEQMYQQRPSREEDLLYITQLMVQNKSLISLCNEANQKTDSAYVALQQYHSKLQSYKKLVPMNINGGVPPQMYNTRQVISRTGRSQSIKPFNPNNSWMMSEPNTSRKLNKTSKYDDDTFDRTKDILVTDFELSGELGSPLKRKHLKIRPQTSNVLSMRKRSAIH